MKKLVNITHTDLDGAGCTAICQYFAGKNGYEVEFFKCGYSTVNDRVREVTDRIESGEEIDMVLITDISVKEGTNTDVLLDRVIKANPNMVVRLLDHHATAAWLNKYDWAEVSEKDSDGVKRCGTWWTYKFLSKYFGEFEENRIYDVNKRCVRNNYQDLLSQDPVFEFVKAVDLYDTWKWVEDYPEGEPFELAGDLNKLLKIKGFNTFLDDCQNRFNMVTPECIQHKNYHSALISETDCLVIKYKEAEIERQISQKNRELIIGKYRLELQTDKQVELIKKHILEKYASNKAVMFSELRKWRVGSSRLFNVGVVYCNDNLSEVGSALSKSHPELDFIILISLPGTISFRSCKNLEVPLGIIANVIGLGQGGGHPQSSGTPIKFAISKRLMEDVIPGLDLRQI